jgi:tetratricopeptide (TPR) repeat protein
MGKLADLLREEGHFSQARRLIEHALSIAPWNANLRYIYGRLLVDMNLIDEARAQFARSLQLDPTFSRAYLGEGIVLLKEGKPDDAIKELSKASLFEPYLSEVHSFLGIAYYQKHDAGAALKELRTAEECDPLDSTPHQLSSAIYNDLYRPVEAIGEARRVLELFPYRKASGEALLEGAQNGIMSVNYGLNFLDLPEWSLYYALKALFWDPYRNTSHFGVANAYLELGQVSRLQGLNAFLNPYLSEQLQGFTLNVNSLNLSNRYTTLISGPGHYLTLGGTYGTGDSNESLLDLKATGDFGSRFPLTYWLYTNAYWDTGSLPHSEYKEATGRVVLGYKPAYDQDIYMDLNYIKDKGEVTPLESSTLTTPDANQQLKEDMYWIQLGYHKRFSPSSHLLMGLRYLNSLEKAENPDFETDGSGFDSSRTKLRNLAFGLRHMLTLHEDHQVSYGVDYHIVDLSEDESWSYPQLALSYGNQISLKRSTLTPYVYDRWALNSILTLDGGLFLSYYGTESDVEVEDSVAGPSTIKLLDRNALRLNPRLGATLDLWKKGALRVAYQTRSTTGFAGELAPVGTSGLISPTFDIFFNEAKDVQGSLEYELTPNTFLKALLGYETLGDIESKTRAQLFYGGIALNQILGRYFSFSARYNYNDGHYRDGSDLKLAGIPLNSGDARLVFVHPWQIAMTLRESYVGQRYADFQNKIKLKGYFSTDFYAQKEMFNKRLFASFSVKDIFNTQFQTASGLPAKGRTFYFRLEYRI